MQKMPPKSRKVQLAAHCKLNFIEMFWGAVKRYTRNNCDYSFKGLEKIIPEALNSISLEKIRCFARRTWRFIDAYRKGLTGIEALYAVKKYRSYWQIPENIIAICLILTRCQSRNEVVISDCCPFLQDKSIEN